MDSPDLVPTCDKRFGKRIAIERYQVKQRASPAIIPMSDMFRNFDRVLSDSTDKRQDETNNSDIEQCCNALILSSVDDFRLNGDVLNVKSKIVCPEGELHSSDVFSEAMQASELNRLFCGDSPLPPYDFLSNDSLPSSVVYNPSPLFQFELCSLRDIDVSLNASSGVPCTGASLTVATTNDEDDNNIVSSVIAHIKEPYNIRINDSFHTAEFTKVSIPKENEYMPVEMNPISSFPSFPAYISDDQKSTEVETVVDGKQSKSITDNCRHHALCFSDELFVKSKFRVSMFAIVIVLFFTVGVAVLIYLWYQYAYDTYVSIGVKNIANPGRALEFSMVSYINSIGVMVESVVDSINNGVWVPPPPDEKYSSRLSSILWSYNDIGIARLSIVFYGTRDNHAIQYQKSGWSVLEPAPAAAGDSKCFHTYFTPLTRQMPLPTIPRAPDIIDRCGYVPSSRSWFSFAISKLSAGLDSAFMTVPSRFSNGNIGMSMVKATSDKNIVFGIDITATALTSILDSYLRLSSNVQIAYVYVTDHSTNTTGMLAASGFNVTYNAIPPVLYPVEYFTSESTGLLKQSVEYMNGQFGGLMNVRSKSDIISTESLIYVSKFRQRTDFDFILVVVRRNRYINVEGLLSVSLVLLGVSSICGILVLFAEFWASCQVVRSRDSDNVDNSITRSHDQLVLSFVSFFIVTIRKDDSNRRLLENSSIILGRVILFMLIILFGIWFMWDLSISDSASSMTDDIIESWTIRVSQQIRNKLNLYHMIGSYIHGLWFDGLIGLDMVGSPGNLTPKSRSMDRALYDISQRALITNSHTAVTQEGTYLSLDTGKSLNITSFYFTRNDSCSWTSGSMKGIRDPKTYQIDLCPFDPRSRPYSVEGNRRLKQFPFAKLLWLSPYFSVEKQLFETVIIPVNFVSASRGLILLDTPIDGISTFLRSASSSIGGSSLIYILDRDGFIIADGSADPDELYINDVSNGLTRKRYNESKSGLIAKYSLILEQMFDNSLRNAVDTRADDLNLVALSVFPLDVSRDWLVIFVIDRSDIGLDPLYFESRLTFVVVGTVMVSAFILLSFYYSYLESSSHVCDDAEKSSANNDRNSILINENMDPLIRIGMEEWAWMDTFKMKRNERWGIEVLVYADRDAPCHSLNGIFATAGRGSLLFAHVVFYHPLYVYIMNLIWMVFVLLGFGGDPKFTTVGTTASWIIISEGVLLAFLTIEAIIKFALSYGCNRLGLSISDFSVYLLLFVVLAFDCDYFCRAFGVGVGFMRPLRPMLYFVRKEPARLLLRSLILSLTHLKDILIVYFIYILVVALLSMAFFSHVLLQGGQTANVPYAFDDLQNSYFSTVILVITAENFADIFLESNDISLWYFCFIAIVTIIGTFFITGLVIATFLDAYTAVSDKSSKENRRNIINALACSFRMADTDSSGGLSLEEVQCLFFSHWLSSNEISFPSSLDEDVLLEESSVADGNFWWRFTNQKFYVVSPNSGFLLSMKETYPIRTKILESVFKIIDFNSSNDFDFSEFYHAFCLAQYVRNMNVDSLQRGGNEGLSIVDILHFIVLGIHLLVLCCMGSTMSLNSENAVLFWILFICQPLFLLITILKVIKNIFASEQLAISMKELSSVEEASVPHAIGDGTLKRYLYLFFNYWASSAEAESVVMERRLSSLLVLVGFFASCYNLSLILNGDSSWVGSRYLYVLYSVPIINILFFVPVVRKTMYNAAVIFKTKPAVVICVTIFSVVFFFADVAVVLFAGKNTAFATLVLSFQWLVSMVIGAGWGGIMQYSITNTTSSTMWFFQVFIFLVCALLVALYIGSIIDLYRELANEDAKSVSSSNYGWLLESNFTKKERERINDQAKIVLEEVASSFLDRMKKRRSISVQL